VKEGRIRVDNKLSIKNSHHLSNESLGNLRENVVPVVRWTANVLKAPLVVEVLR